MSLDTSATDRSLEYAGVYALRYLMPLGERPNIS